MLRLSRRLFSSEPRNNQNIRQRRRVEQRLQSLPSSTMSDEEFVTDMEDNQEEVNENLYEQFMQEIPQMERFNEEGIFINANIPDVPNLVIGQPLNNFQNNNGPIGNNGGDPFNNFVNQMNGNQIDNIRNNAINALRQNNRMNAGNNNVNRNPANDAINNNPQRNAGINPPLNNPHAQGGVNPPRNNQPGPNRVIPQRNNPQNNNGAIPLRNNQPGNNQPYHDNPQRHYGNNEEQNIFRLANARDGAIMSYAIPNLTQLHTGIRRPHIGATHFSLKPIMFTMLQANGQFAGLPSEDPHSHLRSFMEITDSFLIPNVSDDALRLKLFPFSLRDRARAWYNSLAPDSVITWNQMAERFLKNIFHP